MVVGREVFNPANEAMTYFKALNRGDVATVLGDSSLGTTQGSPGVTTVSLLTPGDISAVLAHSRTNYTNLRVISSSTAGSTATVQLGYSVGGADQRMTLTLSSAHGSNYKIFPKWTVIVTPTVLSITSPSYAQSITVGGLQVPVNGSDQQSQSTGAGQQIQASVYPVKRLTVSATGNDVYSPSSQTVDASNGTAQVDLSSSHIKGSVSRAVKQAVVTALQTCIAATSLQPPDCPQSTSSSDSNPTNVQWTAIGAIPTDSTVTYMGNDVFSVTGEQQMSGSYAYSNPVDPNAISDPFSNSGNGTQSIDPQSYSFDYDVTLQGGTWTAIPSSLYTPSSNSIG